MAQACIVKVCTLQGGSLSLGRQHSWKEVLVSSPGELRLLPEWADWALYCLGRDSLTSHGPRQITSSLLAPFPARLTTWPWVGWRMHQMWPGIQREMRTTILSPRPGVEGWMGKEVWILLLTPGTKRSLVPISQKSLFILNAIQMCAIWQTEATMCWFLCIFEAVRDFPLKCPSNSSFTGSLLKDFNIFLKAHKNLAHSSL